MDPVAKGFQGSIGSIANRRSQIAQNKWHVRTGKQPIAAGDPGKDVPPKLTLFMNAGAYHGGLLGLAPGVRREKYTPGFGENKESSNFDGQKQAWTGKDGHGQANFVVKRI